MGFSPRVYRQEEASMASIGMDRQLALPILGFEIRDWATMDGPASPTAGWGLQTNILSRP